MSFLFDIAKAAMTNCAALHAAKSIHATLVNTISARNAVELSSAVDVMRRLCAA